VIKHYPKNELTKYLMDLRKYRPKCIQSFFLDLESSVKSINSNGVSGILHEQKNHKGLCYLLGILEEIYFFRNGHWQFVQKYIMANTKYSKATGGTPIISWIPNQMKAVMKEMRNIIDVIDNYNLKDNYQELELFKRIKMSLNKKEKLLKDQLEVVNKKIFSSDEVFELNKKYNLSDN
jgi:indoleamine 2,3-dioxygenase